MQDIHSIGGGGRIFASGGGDRRLRPHNHPNHQALKCPRCDSLNTKFCYYNNYNLSQPRHFCKNCRRYWTKGGVLRNVPVGGGCRKAKRAKTKSSPETADAAPPPPHLDQQNSNSNSSSENSSLTAAANNVANSAAGGAEAVSAQSSQSNLLNHATEYKFFGSNSAFDTGLLEQGSDCGIFSEIGNFSNLISTSSSETMPFGFGIMNPHEWHNQNQNQQKMNPEIIAGNLLNQTVEEVELTALQNRSNEFGPLDWQGHGDQGLFDLPTTVDHTYWSQNQWNSDQDHPSLYLP